MPSANGRTIRVKRSPAFPASLSRRSCRPVRRDNSTRWSYNGANLQAWLDSPERQRLREEAKPFTEEFHARIARSGFDQWFRLPSGTAPAVWKQNMIVLLLLYPIVFLFSYFVQTPILLAR